VTDLLHVKTSYWIKLLLSYQHIKMHQIFRTYSSCYTGINGRRKQSLKTISTIFKIARALQQSSAYCLQLLTGAQIEPSEHTCLKVTNGFVLRMSCNFRLAKAISQET
jgi:hypothetical protein